MKKELTKLLSLLLCAAMLLPMLCVGAAADTGGSAAAAEEAVVYLREGGKGDGSSLSSPIGTLSEAMRAAAKYNVAAKIQVIGEYRMDFASGAFYSPTHTNLIVISGKGTYGKIHADTTNGDYAKWYLNGDLQFEDIELGFFPWRLFFITQFHDLYMLDGITMTDGSNKIGIIPAISSTTVSYDGKKYNGDYKIVLLSGVYDAVTMFAQGGAKGDLAGGATLAFGGTAEAWRIHVSHKTAKSVDRAQIYLDGGAVRTGVAYHDIPKSTTDAQGVAGARESFKITVTDNFDIENSFTVGFPSEPAKFGGISGTSVCLDGSACVGDPALGSYSLEIETDVYDDVIPHVNQATFDQNGIKRIRSGSGMADDVIPPTWDEMHSPEKYIYGDVNGDGAFNNTDITELVRFLSGNEVSGKVPGRADIDKNNKLNNRDAIDMILSLNGIIPSPDSRYSADKYRIITKAEYLDKTTAAFLGQLAGFLSGHEFAKGADGKCLVAMPDEKFVYLQGPYAVGARSCKHIYNEDSGIWEVWFDDDFSVDIVNQYILSDMYENTGTVCQKYITDGWLNYDVWDMGGGQRKVGAYGLSKRYGYLPQFLGNTETENWYSFISEPYLGTDTLGMSAAGMPETARELAAVFSQATGDRDNLLWAQMFSAMISNAYFEDDVESVIREACKVFPEGSWPTYIAADVFDIYEKHPNDWRAAFTEYEKKHYIASDITSTADTAINCGFVLLELLYGGGDYMETCRIGSLAGYDCESTCGIALAVLGAMGGTDILPEETNTYVWQDGDGVLVNLVAPGHKDDQGVWMIAAGLPSRMKISDIIDKYRENFESVLLEQGGAMDTHYYYIPREELKEYDVVEIENSQLADGTLDGYSTKGTVTVTKYASVSHYGAKLEGTSELTQRVSGLEIGQTYALSAFMKATGESCAYLFASSADGSDTVCASVCATVGTPKYEAHSSFKRTLYFTAVDTEMIIGVRYNGGEGEYAAAGVFELVRTSERTVGKVDIIGKNADDTYAGSISLAVSSETDREVYLKVRFANTNGKVTNAPLTVNGTKYATAAFYKTAAADGAENIDIIYIPLVLSVGENTVCGTYDGSLTVYDAELVEFSDRFGG